MIKILCAMAISLTFTTVNAIAGIVIENMWIEDDYMNTVVTYKNDTCKTYDSVTIQCKTRENNCRITKISSRSFDKQKCGPIVPGFEGTIKIPIALNGQAARSVKCTAKRR